MILPSHEYLDEKGIPYEKRTFATATEKGAANVARALGFREHQMVKTLIFETGSGENVLVVEGGDRSVVSGHLKKAVGSRDIKLAGLETVKKVTGYEVGSVPPFHWQPGDFRSFLDSSLATEEVLGVGAGEWGNEIIITPGNLLEASRATVVNLTDKSKPVFENNSP